MLKAIIADDENKICQLIRALVDWDTLDVEVIGTAENGLKAIELVDRFDPEILITDIRMPGCDGLELIEKVHEKHPEIRIIIISGYAHFEYAQQAIRFGVGEYLLKPISRTEINNALKRLCDQIHEKRGLESEPSQIHVNSEKDLRNLRRRLISNLLETSDFFPTMQLLHDDYHLSVQPGLFQVACIKMDYQPDTLSTAARNVLYEKIRDIFGALLRPLCFEIISEMKDSLVIGIMNYAEPNRKEVRVQMRECLNQLTAQKSLYGKIEFSASLGSAVSRSEEIPHSFQEALLIIRERLTLGSGHLLENLPEPSTSSLQNLLEDYDRQITAAMEGLNQEKADDVMRQIRSELSQKKYSGAQLLEFAHQAGTILFLRAGKQMETLQYSPDGTAEPDAPSANLEKAVTKYHETCDLCDSRETLLDWLEQQQNALLAQRIEVFENNAQWPIRRAKHFIHDHYAEPITLEDVSGFVGLSSGYFSTLFKKETGEGFAKYLISFRIDQAKRLLRETNLPISVISEKVGYYDRKHFSSTFEKLTGVTPGIFRKLYG